MKICLLVAAFLGATNAFSLEKSFDAFKTKFGKDYSEQEHAYRLKVYASNLQFIEEHNRKNSPFSVAINQFADLTNEEFRSIYNGFKRENSTSMESLHKYNPMFSLPEQVDWRTKGVVSPVKDQGQCGSCWSFSATGSMEAQHALKTSQLVSLSEQNLVDCSTTYGNEGCSGGLMTAAFQYVIDNKGDDTEASYPYEAQDGKCRFKPANIGAQISSFKNIPSKDETALQNAVATIGPVSIAIDASQMSFQFYSSGVYYEPNCSSDQLDHGVLAVGYGTDDGQDYWLVKNSWGATWGSEGYIKMARNHNNNCGIATSGSYPLV